MCLAVPVKIKEIISEKKALVEHHGVNLEIARTLLPDLAIGDYVLVHAGFAIEKLTPEDAAIQLEIFEEYFEKTGRRL